MNDFRLMRFGFEEDKDARIRKLMMYFSNFLKNEILMDWRTAK